MSSWLKADAFPEAGVSSSYMCVLVCFQIRPSAKGEAAAVVTSVTRIRPLTISSRSLFRFSRSNSSWRQVRHVSRRMGKSG